MVALLAQLNSFVGHLPVLSVFLSSFSTPSLGVF